MPACSLLLLSFNCRLSQTYQLIGISGELCSMCFKGLWTYVNFMFTETSLVLAPFTCSRGPPLQQQLHSHRQILSFLWQASRSDPGISHGRESSLASLSSPSEQWHCSLASSSLPSILSSLVAPLCWLIRVILMGKKVSPKRYLLYGISVPPKSVPHHIPCSVSLKEITSSKLKAVWI